MEKVRDLVRATRRVIKGLYFMSAVFATIMITLAIISMVMGEWGGAFWLLAALLLTWTTEMRVNSADRFGYEDGARSVVEIVWPHLNLSDEEKARLMVVVWRSAVDRESHFKRVWSSDDKVTMSRHPQGPPDIESIP